MKRKTLFAILMLPIVMYSQLKNPLNINAESVDVFSFSGSSDPYNTIDLPFSKAYIQQEKVKSVTLKSEIFGDVCSYILHYNKQGELKQFVYTCEEEKDSVSYNFQIFNAEKVFFETKTNNYFGKFETIYDYNFQNKKIQTHSENHVTISESFQSKLKKTKQGNEFILMQDLSVYNCIIYLKDDKVLMNRDIITSDVDFIIENESPKGKNIVFYVVKLTKDNLMAKQTKFSVMYYREGYYNTQGFLDAARTTDFKYRDGVLLNEVIYAFDGKKKNEKKYVYDKKGMPLKIVSNETNMVFNYKNEKVDSVVYTYITAMGEKKTQHTGVTYEYY